MDSRSRRANGATQLDLFLGLLGAMRGFLQKRQTLRVNIEQRYDAIAERSHVDAGLRGRCSVNHWTAYLRVFDSTADEAILLIDIVESSID